MIEGNVQAMLVNGVTVVQVRLCVHGHNGSGFAAVPLCPFVFGWHRWCSGRRRARPLCVPVGGGPPASRPRCELRSARRLEARPGPAAAHRHRGRSLRRPPHQWGRVAVWWFGASARCPARPRRRPWVPQPGPVGQAARLSETPVAFARSRLCGVETPVAFAGAGRSLTETVIAFAGEKWVFLVQFSGAEVLSVSAVPCWGRAVVLLVSTSLCCRASCAKKFALLGLMVCVSAKKFALHAQNTPKSAFDGPLGEFFRGNVAGGAVLGELFRGRATGGAALGEFFRAIGPAPRSCRRRGARGWLRWGFCSIRNWLPACRRRVTPLMTPFPPIGDGETVMFDVCPAVSHAIPLWLFQDLNWHRWNCNDSGGC